MENQPAEVLWREGAVPFSVLFQDPYYSLEDGLEEARHVFLEGNDLPQRLHAPLHVAELGFGTGLNLLATLALWDAAGRRAPLHFISFEAFPMRAGDVGQALRAFPDLAPYVPLLCDPLAAGRTDFDLVPHARLTLHIGDARQLLPAWDGAADAWYLDGFAPARNPELWSAEMIAEVARHTRPGGGFATYTAAGFVRRALADAGFTVERVPGYGRKRHMTRGRLP